MAVKISELPAVTTSVSITDLFEVDNGGTSRSATPDLILKAGAGTTSTISLTGGLIIGAAGTGTGHPLDVQSSAPNTVQSLRVYNTSNTATADARVLIQTGGSSAEFAYIAFYNSANAVWTVGINSTDATAGTGSLILGTSNSPYLKVQSTGHSSIGFVRPGTDAGAIQTVCGLYAGSGVPSNANGQNGDYYFRSDGTASAHIYFKTGGSWTGIV